MDLQVEQFIIQNISTAVIHELMSLTTLHTVMYSSL